MENTRPITQVQYFNDPDMPFYGYPKTEENIAAVKKLWEDAKPKARAEDMVDLMYGTPENSDSNHQELHSIRHKRYQLLKIK